MYVLTERDRDRKREKYSNSDKKKQKQKRNLNKLQNNCWVSPTFFHTMNKSICHI